MKEMKSKVIMLGNWIGLGMQSFLDIDIFQLTMS